MSGVSARSAFATLIALALGCATVPRTRDHLEVTPDDLRAGASLGLEASPTGLIDDAAVLAVSPEMRDFVRAHLTRGADRSVRLRQLTRAIVDEDRFGLHYDETTRTASETFRTRRGNCLSFSSMFVAMARHAGLHASFQEVDVPPDWSLRADAFVLNRHVNVVVNVGRGVPATQLGSLVGRPVRAGEHVVDFNMDDFRTTYDRRTIPDARALAHFCNNLAVESMAEGDFASALPYFRRAIAHDPLFSPAWTNLGILYLRKGHLEHAEAAYLQALKADGSDLVAMSNLAHLYDRQGNDQRAAAYRSRVAAHRQHNPYYRFQLAREAFEAGDYDAAIQHLKYAIRRQRNEDRFHFLLGLTHMKQGNEQAARRSLARAQEVAATDSLKRRYASKIDVLLSGMRGGQ